MVNTCKNGNAAGLLGKLKNILFSVFRWCQWCRKDAPSTIWWWQKKIRLSSRKILQKPPEKSIRLKWANKPAVFAQSGNATNASLKRPPKLNAKVAESFCNYHVLNDKLSEGQKRHTSTWYWWAASHWSCVAALRCRRKLNCVKRSAFELRQEPKRTKDKRQEIWKQGHKWKGHTWHFVAVLLLYCCGCCEAHTFGSFGYPLNPGPFEGFVLGKDGGIFDLDAIRLGPCWGPPGVSEISMALTSHDSTALPWPMASSNGTKPCMNVHADELRLRVGLPMTCCRKLEDGKQRSDIGRWRLVGFPAIPLGPTMFCFLWLCHQDTSGRSQKQKTETETIVQTSLQTDPRSTDRALSMDC